MNTDFLTERLHQERTAALLSEAAADRLAREARKAPREHKRSAVATLLHRTRATRERRVTRARSAG